MSDIFLEIFKEISQHPDNAAFKERGWQPLYTASKDARIVIIGQAPGIKAQESGTPWDDKSGETLRDWLGITREQFYDPKLVALIPMDFYYPGKGKSGDLPPRKDFTPLWHPKLLQNMPNVKLIILIGAYSQKYYLGKAAKKTLTETVANFEEYLPKYFPLVHPSPLNFRWQAKNYWFLEEVVPVLKKEIYKAFHQ